MKRDGPQYLGEGWSAEEARSFVSACYERDALLTVMLHFGAAAMRGRAVFLVSNEDVTPYLSSATWLAGGGSGGAVDAIDLPIGGNEALARLASSREPTRGSPRELGLDPLFARSEIVVPDELVAFPLQLGGRTRVLFVGEPRQERGDELEAAWSIARAVADQLETIIKLAKSRALPPRAERIPALPERFRVALGDEPVAEPEDAYPELAGRPASEAESLEPRRTLQLELDDGPPTSDFEAVSAPEPAPRGAGATAELEETLDRERTAPAAAGLSDARRQDDSSARPIGRIARRSSSSATASGGMRSIGDEPTNEHPPGSSPSAPRPGEAEPAPEISIVEPIGVREGESGGKTTLLGGYSLDDIRRAQSLYAEEKPYSKTMPGVSMPQAKILKPRGARSKARRAGLPARPLSGVTSHKSGLALPPREGLEQEPDDAPSGAITEPLATVGLSARGDLSADLEQDRSRDAPEEMSASQPPWGPESEPPPEGVAIDGGTFPARVMPALDTSSHPSQAPEESDEVAALFGPAREAAFEAAERVEPSPQLLERLRRAFPGRIYIDRYQYSARDLPAVDRHGPLLRAATRFGEAAAPVVASMLEDPSLEVRFYATFLFTKLSPRGHLAAIGRRLFDRDLQTRRVARLVLFAAREDPEFAPIARSIRARLGAEDEAQVHAAASLTGALRDAGSIEPLIECLERTQGRVKAEVHKALQRICLQAHPPSAPLWRAWYAGARGQPRSTWLLIGMNHESAFVRRLAAEELREIGAEVGRYDPNQPAHLRASAQEQVRDWMRSEKKL